MRQGTYLNVVLTVVAVLLTALLWTQIVSSPVFERSASAEQSKLPGIPNAANQRDTIIYELRELRRTADTTRKAMESGSLRVEVVNWDEFRFEEP